MKQIKRQSEIIRQPNLCKFKLYIWQLFLHNLAFASFISHFEVIKIEVKEERRIAMGQSFQQEALIKKHNSQFLLRMFGQYLQINIVSNFISCYYKQFYIFQIQMFCNS
ncbi:hypothetical protein ABPG72_003245 [Tetrahymena utriculariae]